jgi:glycine/D-amino acid oxidase-like deaminating enzyme
VYYAREARHVDKLGRELRLRLRARLGGRWLDPRAIRGLAGIDAEGGILTPGNAQVDPYRGCLAIARAAVRDGASLHEHAHVRRIQRNRDAVDLTLENGARVSAGVAVIATGYATPEFEPFSSRFRMMNTYVVATRRLTTRERREVGLGDVMLWDSGRPYYYARWTADGRLLFGGRDRPRLRGAMRPATLRRVAAQLTADLATLWPSLEGVRPEYAWEGLFAQTPDGLPFIGTHRRYPRQLFALGYGGNGMTLGFFAARAVVRIAQGRPGPDDHLFAMSRFSRAHRYSR